MLSGLELLMALVTVAVGATVMVTDIAAFVLYVWAGPVGWNTVASIAILLPGLALGFGLATLVVHRMSEEAFR